MSNIVTEINAARDVIQARTAIRPQLAVILGSGLGGLADEIEVDSVIPYEEIPGCPVSTVPGHAGQLLLGKLEGKKVVVMQGRFHYLRRLSHGPGCFSDSRTSCPGGPRHCL